MNCDIGSNYKFKEYPDTYALGLNYPLPNNGNVYRCLDECRRDSQCLAVSVSNDVIHQCQAYSETPLQLTESTDWNYYEFNYVSSCIVGMSLY